MRLFLPVTLHLLTLKMELSFLAALSEAINDKEPVQLVSPPEFIAESIKKQWGGENLQFLSRSLLKSKEKVEMEFKESFATDDSVSFNEVLAVGISRLNLLSNRIDSILAKKKVPAVATWLIGQIAKATAEIDKEILLLPYLELITKIMVPDPQEVASHLTVVSASIGKYLAKDGVEKVKGPAYGLAEQYWNALNYYVIKDIAQADNAMPGRINFWLNVLKILKQQKDIHSILAINIALDVFRNDSKTKAIFTHLDSSTAAINSSIQKKFSLLSTNMPLLGKYHKKSKVVVPYTGAYKARFITINEQIKLAQPVLQIVNLLNLFLKKGDYDVLLPLYKEPPQEDKDKPNKAITFLSELIATIPEQELLSKIPANYQQYSLTQIPWTIAKEFESAVLLPYHQQLNNYTDLQKFVKKQEAIIAAMAKEQTEVKSEFAEHQPQAEKFLSSHKVLAVLPQFLAECYQLCGDTPLIAPAETAQAPRNLKHYSSHKLSLFTDKKQAQKSRHKSVPLQELVEDDESLDLPSSAPPS